VAERSSLLIQSSTGKKATQKVHIRPEKEAFSTLEIQRRTVKQEHGVQCAQKHPSITIESRHIVNERGEHLIAVRQYTNLHEQLQTTKAQQKKT
jgi:hypothetical protein